MDIRELIIGHKVKTNSKTIISCSFINIEVNEYLIQNPIDFEKEWISKRIFFTSNNIMATIRGIEVSSNVIGFKTVHFLLDSNFFDIAKEGDIVKVE